MSSGRFRARPGATLKGGVALLPQGFGWRAESRRPPQGGGRAEVATRRRLARRGHLTSDCIDPAELVLALFRMTRRLSSYAAISATAKLRLARASHREAAHGDSRGIFERFDMCHLAICLQGQTFARSEIVAIAGALEPRAVSRCCRSRAGMVKAMIFRSSHRDAVSA